MKKFALRVLNARRVQNFFCALECLSRTFQRKVPKALRIDYRVLCEGSKSENRLDSKKY